MPNLRVILSLASTIALAGCVETDARGRPIAREVRGEGRIDPMEAAVANATLDGGRVVASGRPPIAFLYPGNGRLVVRDVESNTIPFSMDLPQGDGVAIKTMVAIDGSGKLVGTAAGDNGPVRTEIAALNKGHTFIITYAPPAVAEAIRKERATP